MKIQLETIKPASNSSFQLLTQSRLNDFYFWHYHPEIELNYIEADQGNRHIGEHVSKFENSNLVMIGSNMPHLNQDYGIRSEYTKVVLHIQPDFLQEALMRTPELASIQQLFERSKLGISFEGATKNEVGSRMKQLANRPHFEQFVEVLGILQLLALSTKATLLHQHPLKNPYNKKALERQQQLHRFIETHYQRKIELEEVAALCHMTKIAFCRFFKQATHLTFTGYLNRYRVHQAQRLLLLNQKVSEVSFDCGFESVSYFNRVFKEITLLTPLEYKRSNRYA